MRVTDRKSPPAPWVRPVALLGLVAYLAGLGWFTALFTAAIALWDGGHQVRIESRVDRVRVVLGHDRLHRAGSPHALLASALTSIAAPTSSTAPDHVIDLGPDSGVIARVDADDCNPADLLPPSLAPTEVAIIDLPATEVPGVVPTPAVCVPSSLRVARTHVRLC